MLLFSAGEEGFAFAVAKEAVGEAEAGEVADTEGVDAEVGEKAAAVEGAAGYEAAKESL